jgi:hypothetical protein|tara:strand:+ start:67 stop:441 length:375 start_codon:yes stop_codon:yes gene_type:complete
MIEQTDNFESNFNYDNITFEHKEAIKEVITILRDSDQKGVPLNMIIPMLRVKFGVEDIPEMSLDESKMIKLARQFQEKTGQSIGETIQGYTLKSDNYKVPHISFSSDLDILDEFLKFVKENKND